MNFIKLFGSWPPKIGTLVIDFSLALANSICFIFNEMQIDDYLMSCFKKIFSKFEFLKITISFCSAHVIKDFSINLKQKNIDYAARKSLKHFFGSLFCEKDPKKFFHLLHCLITLMNSPFIGANCEKYLDELKFGGKNVKLKNFNVNAIMKKAIESKKKSLYKKSPFFALFEHYSSCFKVDSSGIANKLYCPDIAKIIIRNYIRFIPMWSSLLHDRKTNSSVETLNKILKIDIFDKKTKLKPSKAIRLIQTYADSKILHQKFNLTQNKGKKVKEDEEFWSKNPSYLMLNEFTSILIV